MGRAASSPVILYSIFFFFLVSGHHQLATAKKFTVGDDKMWSPGVNYTSWEQKHRPFHVGDWLVFLYQKGQANVLQVDEASYNKCDASNPITNYSKGRSYAFELNETKRYYFICSYGYCYQGMKLTVKAAPLPPPSPPPSSSDHKSNAPPTRAAPGLGSSLAILLMAVSLVFPLCCH